MPTKSNNIGGRGGKRIGAGRKKKSVVEKGWEFKSAQYFSDILCFMLVFEKNES